MKSKEEILRKNNYLDEDGFIDINAIHKSMEEYATQCQDKKYTEEDMIGFLNWSLGMEVVEMICNNKTKQEIFQKYINSLNKQKLN